MWEPRYGFDGEDEYEYERLHRTLRVDDADALASFLNRLEAGRVAAEPRTHRVETALRFFNRISNDYLRHHVMGYGDDLDVNEDLVIDAVAGLEAIFLANEKRGKGQAIGMRVAAVLENDVVPQSAMRKQMIELY
jgi:hypothetical protein